MNWQNTFWLTLLVIASIGYIDAQYISEFHYNNAGSDEGEFVEVVIPDPQPIDLSEYKIYLYKGTDGTSYDGRGLQGIVPQCLDNLCYYIWSKQPFIQNGTDGIAFLRETATDTALFDFVSYGGTITATDAGALGAMSMDIGIEESNSTPVGYSLQKGSNGIWFAGPQTRGSVNPIELITFEGWYRSDREKVLLQWSTASESNNDYFELQRSSDQKKFYPIVNVPGAGSSQEVRTYEYWDTGHSSGKVFYRLKQVDFGGAYRYSPTILIERPIHSQLQFMKPYYYNGELHIRKNHFRNGVELTLYNAMGQLLFHRNRVYGGDVIPMSLPQTGIIFFHIRSQGQAQSGRIMFTRN